MIEDLRYPIGTFDSAIEVTPQLRQDYIQTIIGLPAILQEAVDGLTEEQLETVYRPEGWTVRQVVHHIADSHINSLCRFKLALTEDVPTIRPYAEAHWAELSDSKMPVQISLQIIEGIHAKWAKLLIEMSDDDYQRELIHPESGKWTLEKLLGMYSWHSKHHTAHITGVRDRNSW